MTQFCEYFGFKSAPFDNQIATKNLLKFPEMVSIKGRLDYAISSGGIMVISGEIGSGKSTSTRWALSHYHPSETDIFNVIANSASINEQYKQLCWALDLEAKTGSRSALAKMFRDALREIVMAKKRQVLFVIDEAHLLKSEVFSEIHTLTQFENDSRNLFTLLFVGQNNLVDKLMLRSSQPLASRVITRIHLKGINRDQMPEYINHHTKIAGVKTSLFDDAALNAIYQGSGGILRSANHLARGGLIAAANEHAKVVGAEHIRIAATELMIGN